MTVIDVHAHVPAASQWDEFLREMRDHGIDITIVSSLGVSGWPQFPDSAQIRAANEQAEEFSRYAGGRILWLAYLNPQNDDWPEELTRCVERGCRGIKLWISLRDPVTGSLERTPPVLERAQELGLPVLIHTFHRTDPLLPGEVSVADVAAWGRQFPGLTLIAAHAGCNWHQTQGILYDIPNVLVDVCGGMPEAGMVETLTDELGAARVLYGSDALGRSFSSQLAKVRLATVTEAEQEEILGRAAARVFRITEADLAAARQAAASLPATPWAVLPDMTEDHFLFAGDLPFRYSPLPEMADLTTALRRHGIGRAFCAFGPSLYALDMAAENRLLAGAVAALGDDCLQPLATLLPTAYNWRETLAEARRLCAGGIVFPYLHDWDIRDSQFRDFFAACADAHFPLWINVNLHDYRFRPRGTSPRRTASVETIDFLATAPVNSYVIQGAAAAEVQAGLALGRADVRFDISRLVDSSGALRNTIARHGADRLVLGSEFPFRHLRTNAACARWICQPEDRKTPVKV